jgi:hypothetical protein
VARDIVPVIELTNAWYLNKAYLNFLDTKVMNLNLKTCLNNICMTAPNHDIMTLLRKFIVKSL